MQRTHQPCSLGLMDVDYFKQINDEHGHAVGDEVLKSLCGTVQGLLRETDIFARLGGEEFGVLLPNTNLDGATILAERLRSSVAKTRFSLNKGELNYTVSIGVAMQRPTDGSFEDCLKRADRAMYKAKEKGRNKIDIED